MTRTGQQQQIPGSILHVAYYHLLQPVAYTTFPLYYLLPTTYCLLCAARCLLPTAYYLPRAACCCCLLPNLPVAYYQLLRLVQRLPRPLAAEYGRDCHVIAI